MHPFRGYSLKALAAFSENSFTAEQMSIYLRLTSFSSKLKVSSIPGRPDGAASRLLPYLSFSALV